MTSDRRPLPRTPRSARWLARMTLAVGIGMTAAGCAAPGRPATQPAAATQPEPLVLYDTTAQKSVPPEDWLEAYVQNRKADIAVVDRLVDRQSAPPDLDRTPPPSAPAGATIGEGVTLLADEEPLAEPAMPRATALRVGVIGGPCASEAQRQAVASLQPVMDAVAQRAPVAADSVCVEADDWTAHLRSGRVALAYVHVLEYLRAAGEPVEPAEELVPLAWAQPGNAASGAGDDSAGTVVMVVVPAGNAHEGPADLKGSRLVVTAGDTAACGALLAQLLQEAGHRGDQPFFGKIHLRTSAAAAVFDLLEGRADAACLGECGLAAVQGLYGLDGRLRVLAVSPQYDGRVLVTMRGMLTEQAAPMEALRQALLTLRRDAEGRQAIQLGGIAAWHAWDEGSLPAAREHLEDYLRYRQGAGELTEGLRAGTEGRTAED